MRSRFNDRSISRRALLKLPATIAVSGVGAFTASCGLKGISEGMARTGIYRVGSYRDSIANVISRALSEFPAVMRRARGAWSF